MHFSSKIKHSVKEAFESGLRIFQAQSSDACEYLVEKNTGAYCIPELSSYALLITKEVKLFHSVGL